VLASTQFTFLSGLSAAGWATNVKGLYLLSFHGLHHAALLGNKMFNCDQCNRVTAAQPAMSPFDQTNAIGSANVEVCLKPNLRRGGKMLAAL